MMGFPTILLTGATRPLGLGASAQPALCQAMVQGITRTFRKANGLDVNFVQDNHSRSGNGVLRSLHYHLLPHGCSLNYSCKAHLS